MKKEMKKSIVFIIAIVLVVSGVLGIKFYINDIPFYAKYVAFCDSNLEEMEITLNKEESKEALKLLRTARRYHFEKPSCMRSDVTIKFYLDEHYCLNKRLYLCGDDCTTLFGNKKKYYYMPETEYKQLKQIVTGHGVVIEGE